MTTIDETRSAESTPLYDLGAERYVLGAMMVDPSTIGDIQELLPEADRFHHPQHRAIYDTIVDLHATGRPTQMMAVAAQLGEKPELLLKTGGVPYLHTCVEEAAVPMSGPYYARIVADRATLRHLDESCDRIKRLIRSGGSPAADLVEQARTAIADLAGRVASTDGPVRWNELMEPALDEAERVQDSDDGTVAGIPTGFTDLDRLINGLQPGKVYVIAGESGSGKSTLASDMVRSAAFVHKQPTVVFNLEMSSTELFNRFVCAHATVNHGAFVSGRMTDQDWTRIAKVCGDTADAPLWIDDSPNLTAADIRVRATKLKRQENLQVMVVDLIGLVTPQSNLPRQEQVAQVSRKFKQLAKELQVAILIVAQINRGPQQRADKRPSIHDLRESAQIGHDADAVILVHRPDKHDKDSPRVGEADLIVDKNRFGAEDTIVVCSQLHYARFYDMPLG